VADMGQRIRQLEDALAIFQSSVTNECHPLLRDELLSIKFGTETHLHSQSEEPIKDISVDSIDTLGTLTINDLGECKYFTGTEVRTFISRSLSIILKQGYPRLCFWYGVSLLSPAYTHVSYLPTHN
jgi:hypothetical protein